MRAILIYQVVLWKALRPPKFFLGVCNVFSLTRGLSFDLKDAWPKGQRAQRTSDQMLTLLVKDSPKNFTSGSILDKFTILNLG
jgi:hypothetical protein